jgi:hypothetical protein
MLASKFMRDRNWKGRIVGKKGRDLIFFIHKPVQSRINARRRRMLIRRFTILHTGISADTDLSRSAREPLDCSACEGSSRLSSAACSSGRA